MVQVTHGMAVVNRSAPPQGKPTPDSPLDQFAALAAEEQVRVGRGLVFGLMFSGALWAGIIAAVAMLRH